LRTHQAPVNPPLRSHILSANAIWYWIIIAIAAITTTLIFTVPEDAYPIVYVRYVLSSIFVLFLPGYSFTKALFPTKEWDIIERTALSIGLSLALVALIGLLLNYTPWGIATTPGTLSLLSITIISATVGIVREHQANLKQPTTHPRDNAAVSA